VIELFNEKQEWKKAEIKKRVQIGNDKYLNKILKNICKSKGGGFWVLKQ
jgi:hypothetical protein